MSTGSLLPVRLILRAVRIGYPAPFVTSSLILFPKDYSRPSRGLEGTMLQDLDVARADIHALGRLGHAQPVQQAEREHQAVVVG